MTRRSKTVLGALTIGVVGLAVLVVVMVAVLPDGASRKAAIPATSRAELNAAWCSWAVHTGGAALVASVQAPPPAGMPARDATRFAVTYAESYLRNAGGTSITPPGVKPDVRTVVRGIRRMAATTPVTPPDVATVEAAGRMDQWIATHCTQPRGLWDPAGTERGRR